MTEAARPAAARCISAPSGSVDISTPSAARTCSTVWADLMRPTLAAGRAVGVVCLSPRHTAVSGTRPSRDDPPCGGAPPTYGDLAHPRHMDHVAEMVAAQQGMVA